MDETKVTMKESTRAKLLARHRNFNGQENWHQKEDCPVIANHARPWELRQVIESDVPPLWPWHLTYSPERDGENSPYERVDEWYCYHEDAVRSLNAHLRAQAKEYADSVGVAV